MRHLLSALLALLTLPAAAATLEIDGSGQLTGARGVDVDGVLYDVTFQDGSCFDLFDGCDAFEDFTFNDADSATAAALAVMDQVYIGAIAADPTLIFGCNNALTCRAMIPYDPNFNPNTFDSIQAQNTLVAPFGATYHLGTVTFDYGIDEPAGYLRTFALFEAVPAAQVPLPGGAALLIPALGLLMWQRSRRRA